MLENVCIFRGRWCGMFFGLHGDVDPHCQERRAGNLAVRSLTDSRWLFKLIIQTKHEMSLLNNLFLSASRPCISGSPKPPAVSLWILSAQRPWQKLYFQSQLLWMFCPATGMYVTHSPAAFAAGFALGVFISLVECWMFKHGYHVLMLNLVKRVNRFRGRPRSLMMRCPVGSVLPNREQIQCDPEFIQVTAGWSSVMSCRSTFHCFNQVFGLFVILTRFICVCRWPDNFPLTTGIMRYDWKWTNISV